MQLSKLIPSVAIAAIAFSSSVAATEPSGVVSNVLLAQGRTISSLKERIKVGAEPSGRFRSRTMGNLKCISRIL